MVNRIREILRKYDLSPSRLADQLEVPRSTISHILSERNKPSMEFILKVLEKYPEIDTDWLIRGKGTISGKEKDLFSDIESLRLSEKEQDTTFPSENKINPAPLKEEPDNSNLREEYTVDSILKSTENQRKGIKKNEQKKIIKIITFYDDDTFSEYWPSNTIS
jgi:transcriptional regulator with XRE-family HTH domain